MALFSQDKVGLFEGSGVFRVFRIGQKGLEFLFCLGQAVLVFDPDFPSIGGLGGGDTRGIVREAFRQGIAGRFDVGGNPYGQEVGDKCLGVGLAIDRGETSHGGVLGVLCGFRVPRILLDEVDFQ